MWEWEAESGDVEFDGSGEAEPRQAGDEWFARVHPADRERAARGFAEHLAGGTASFEAELRFREGDGTHRWHLVRGAAERDGSGRVLRVLGTSVDIEKLKLAEQRLERALADRETLLRELHHRVKNNLQVVSSLLSLELGRMRTPAVARRFREIQSRVQAIAVAHDQLYGPESLAEVPVEAYLSSIVDNAVRTFSPRRCHVTVSVHAPALTVDVETAIRCGLLVNELVSNAARHAFVGRRRGSVDVRLVACAEGGLDLTVADDGVGLPVAFDLARSGGTGLRLATDFAATLGGRLEVLQGTGVRFRLRFSPGTGSRVVYVNGRPGAAAEA